MEKIAVIGSGGQLGRDLCRVLESNDQCEVVGLDHSMIELRDQGSVSNAIASINPEVVVNCGAYVRVDNCESNPQEAFFVNSIGAGYVAQAAAEIDAICVYISTDYVFDGLKSAPYLENDSTYPVNIYGISKLSGEHMVRSYTSKHFIVRSSGLYGLSGSSGKGGNFVETIIKLANESKELNIVDDQILTPTFTEDLALSISYLITKPDFGTYHITNSGKCSWYQFAIKILEFTRSKVIVNPISSMDYGAKAKRPSYSVLSNSKLADIGIKSSRSWEEALQDYISRRI